MRKEGLGYRETMHRFELGDHCIIKKWERIYLEEGAEGLYIERRGRTTGKGGRPPKLDPDLERDLIAENEYLRAENEYPKKLDALVREREQRENGRQ